MAVTSLKSDWYTWFGSIGSLVNAPGCRLADGAQLAAIICSAATTGCSPASGPGRGIAAGFGGTDGEFSGACGRGS